MKIRSRFGDLLTVSPMHTGAQLRENLVSFPRVCKMTDAGV